MTLAVLPPITDLPSLAKALALVRKERGLSQLALDYKAGLASGHSGKIEAGVKNLGSISLPLVLQALGVELRLEIGPAGKFTKHPNLAKQIKTLSPKEKIKLARRNGGVVKNARMSTQQKRAHGRKMAKSRWAKARDRKAQKN